MLCCSNSNREPIQHGNEMVVGGGGGGGGSNGRPLYKIRGPEPQLPLEKTICQSNPPPGYFYKTVKIPPFYRDQFGAIKLTGAFISQGGLFCTCTLCGCIIRTSTYNICN